LQNNWIQIEKLIDIIDSNIHISDLRNKINNFNKNDIEFITQNLNTDSKILKNKIKKQKTTEDNIKNLYTIIINDNYSLNNNINDPTIIVKWWKDIKISQNQAKMIKSNPDLIETIITLNTTLIKVWLPNLINYIDPISNAIWTTWWVNNNDKSLNSSEIQKFLNNILVSIWETEINTVSLEQYTNEFNQKNNIQISWNHKNKKEIWNSDIEERFMKKYIIWFTNFQTNKFKTDIQKKS
jgi:hypothetical protein